MMKLEDFNGARDRKEKVIQTVLTNATDCVKI